MRGCFERNGSAQNGSKRSCKRVAYPYLRGMVPNRTVPKSRVNAALVHAVTGTEIPVAYQGYGQAAAMTLMLGLF